MKRQRTPYENIKARGLKSTWYSPDGYVKIEEFSDGSRFLWHPERKYPSQLSPLSMLKPPLRRNPKRRYCRNSKRKHTSARRYIVRSLKRYAKRRTRSNPQLTLKQWAKKYNESRMKHKNGATYVSAVSGSLSGRALFNLKDYRVSSLTGGTYWLMKK